MEPAGSQPAAIMSFMWRSAGLILPVILACSGAQPVAPRDPPVAGLPPLPEPVPPAAAPSAPRVLGVAVPRYQTVRIREAGTPDPLAAGPRTLGRRVDLELSRAPVAEAFRFLADAADVNVVLGDGVSGDVTLRLRRVTVREALRAVAATHDLQTEWRGNILWVTSTAASAR